LVGLLAVSSASLILMLDKLRKLWFNVGVARRSPQIFTREVRMRKSKLAMLALILASGIVGCDDAPTAKDVVGAYGSNPIGTYAHQSNDYNNRPTGIVIETPKDVASTIWCILGAKEACK
jgi:hypothetical protein